MSDLVKRLRENPNYRHWLVMAEAADEIERLRAALDDIFNLVCEVDTEQVEVTVIDRIYGIAKSALQEGE